MVRTGLRSALAARRQPRFDGAGSHGSAAWKRFARLRVRQAAAAAAAGYDVLLSDADVVWLRDPCPYLQCRANGSVSLPDGCARPLYDPLCSPLVCVPFTEPPAQLSCELSALQALSALHFVRLAWART